MNNPVIYTYSFQREERNRKLCPHNMSYSDHTTSNTYFTVTDTNQLSNFIFSFLFGKL